VSTLHDTIRAAIGSLVGNRYYANHFPQEGGGPTWPAIRGTIVSRDNALDQCGAGEDEEEDARLQIDICSRSYDEADALRTAVGTALAALNPPWIRQPGGFETFDEEAKVHRMTRDWVLYRSST
jgi:hypothetical protein